MEILSKENDEKLKNLRNHLEEAVKVGYKALSKFPTQKYDLLSFTLLGYVERFTFSLESVGILLQHFTSKPNVETSIGLIIRAELLDFMTVTYLSSYYMDINPTDDNGKEEFDKHFNIIAIDQIGNTIKYLKTSKNVGLISDADYKAAIDALWHNYAPFFSDSTIDYDKPENKLLTREYRSPKDLFVRIHNHRLTNKFSSVYDCYTYYSKYEHFGIMTHQMQRQGINNDFNMIVSSLTYILHGISACFAFLNLNGKLNDEKNRMTSIQEAFNQL